MSHRLTRVACAVVATVIVTHTTYATSPSIKSIPLADLRDRIEAAWAGKMIGVSIGFPTEFKFRGELVPEDKYPQWKPAMLRDGLKQDDLYIQMTLAETLKEKGLDATTDDFGAKFRDSKYGLWHAHLAARRLMNRNVPAKDAGSPVHNPHFNDISFQIDADFIGLMSPGMPNSAVEIAHRAGVVIGWGQGIPAGGFMSGMYAAAYFETDPRAVVEAGLKSIPEDCDYAQIIHDVLTMHSEDPADWQKTWGRINEKWDRDDVCPYGALMPLNIDARINGAYVAIGLLYGNGDFEKTIEIATRCGQDSDCNPSTAAGILGAMHGMKLIPAKYLEALPAIRNETFVYTQTTFNSIVEDTLNRAIELAKRNGGRVERDVLHIPMQAPKPIEMPTFAPVGVPVERVVCADARWKWKGKWRDEVSTKSGPEKVAGEKDAEASIEFEGTGVIIVGPLLTDGGVADVYIDGKLNRTIDVYSDEKLRKASDAVYHNFYLNPGQHTLRLVVRGEPYGGSRGSDIRIMALTVLK